MPSPHEPFHHVSATAREGLDGHVGDPLHDPSEGVYGSSCTERERTGPPAWSTAGRAPEVRLLRSWCTVRTPPRTRAQKAGVRARPLLENSTACRKSVPSSNPFVGFFGLIDESVQFSVLARIRIH